MAGCRFELPEVTGDAEEGCTESSNACVCLRPEGVCVECTPEDKRNCRGTVPVCGDDLRCHRCVANEDCASGACLEDGSCAPASRIVYAAPDGVDAAGCGATLGQNACSVAQALVEVGGERDVIRLAAGTYTVVGLSFASKSATLIARGATLQNPSGNVLSVSNGQALKLVGGTLRGAISYFGIECSGGSTVAVHEATIEDMHAGISSNSCSLAVSRSVIRGHRYAGIYMSSLGLADINSNFIYRNGGTGTYGGMVLRPAVGSRVELNTVVDNTSITSSSAYAGGISCFGAITALGNLIYRNRGGPGGLAQVAGAFTSMSSYVQPAAAADENAVGFENPNAAIDPSFRLTESSQLGLVREAFVCQDSLDFEGDRRPWSNMCDVGADEYRTGQ